ncbi:hypothetical protein D3C76_1417340 [compost metagenome]
MPQDVDRAADTAEQLNQHRAFRLLLRDAEVLHRAIHSLEQRLAGSGQVCGGFGQPRQALGTEQLDQQSRTGGVELAKLVEIDLGRGVILAGQAVAAALEAGVVGQGPVTGDPQPWRAACSIQGGAGVCSHRLHAVRPTVRSLRA